MKVSEAQPSNLLVRVWDFVARLCPTCRRTGANQPLVVKEVTEGICQDWHYHVRLVVIVQFACAWDAFFKFSIPFKGVRNYTLSSTDLGEWRLVRFCAKERRRPDGLCWSDGIVTQTKRSCPSPATVQFPTTAWKDLSKTVNEVQENATLADSAATTQSKATQASKAAWTTIWILLSLVASFNHF